MRIWSWPQTKLSLMMVLSISHLFSSVALGDEGMWTLDNLPRQQIKKKYNVDITDEWSDRVRLSSVRLANGCSGSFISEQGLVMTNHHCVRDCIYKLSSAKQDYLAQGFHAKQNSEEKQCPAFEVNRLVEIQDVTRDVRGQLQGLSGESYAKKKKEVSASMEKNCAQDTDKFRCDLVDLYHGGEFHLYRYERYQDVRLVFAPEQAIAHFGGDPDNFNFPRYAYDVSFLRVYSDNKPLKNPHYFSWAKQGIKKGEPTFITGHPGSTQRLLTVDQLKYIRDFQLPGMIADYSELRGLLMQFQKQSKEADRIAKSKLGQVDNGLKALKGRVQALRDESFFARIEQQEKNFRYQLNRNPWRRSKYGDPWKGISQNLKTYKDKATEISYIAFGGFESELFAMARDIVRLPMEKAKPNGERLSEYTEARLPQLQQRLLSPAPIYDELEKLTIEFYLTKMREKLSPDHPFVKNVLGKMSPQQMAHNLVSRTQLKNVKVREKLLKTDLASLKKSTDPMIQLALLVDKDSRELRQFYEDKVDAKISQYSETIAQAKFDVFGKNTYPDATFSLRLSYGSVKGFEEKGEQIHPFTYTKGLYQRATGSDPFALPPAWLKAQSKLSPDTHFNFVSDNDIIGGNSGSPVINKNAEIIGIVFDGNIHSLGGAYAFDSVLNRAVSVDSAIIMEALDKVYGAKSLIKEIQP
jgi:hypothetical protein